MGRDTIATLAALAEHAALACDLSLTRKLWSDPRRRSAATSASRCYRRATAVLPTGVPLAGLLAGWSRQIGTEVWAR